MTEITGKILLPNGMKVEYLDDKESQLFQEKLVKNLGYSFRMFYIGNCIIPLMTTWGIKSADHENNVVIDKSAYVEQLHKRLGDMEYMDSLKTIGSILVDYLSVVKIKKISIGYQDQQAKDKHAEELILTYFHESRMRRPEAGNVVNY